ncbi:MAG: 1-(5-phosphoribosyl)-5-[(5-phosphoribosylamino)methylideneamino]imidazole-4-carboxamide isomerase [Bacteroidetes bacterium]|nr:MAG: 1-(5-phosphoribosyl)-5-[(5-phosphoribosylamino)methylideneamino]imidazole-4-carboxamide isomerase [Bacteroidota bacterium]
MLLIPAIDLMNNHCVRLSQGDFDTQTVYSDDPVQTATQFENMGFTHLHMVDLDGAKKKTPVHLEMLRAVSTATRLFIDFSGGIRNAQQARQVFGNGASAVTIGSMAVHDPDTTEKILKEHGPEKVILGADVKNEFIATAGWLEQSDKDIFSFLEFWMGKGFSKVMITDVSKDGMMQGPSAELYRKVLERFPEIKLIASGGIATIDDIYDLKEIGCYGAITGKALYEGKLPYKELKEFLK